MAVLHPLKVVITNYPEGKTQQLETANNPEDETAGSRTIPFGKTLFIEQDDFLEQPNNKFFRLTIGSEVRLKSAYIIKAERVDKDENDNPTIVYCTYDSKSLSGSGSSESQRKVKATIHWVSSEHAKQIEVRDYDRLFKVPSPDGDKDVDFMSHLNDNSFTKETAYAEPMLAEANPGAHIQFQRLGYFICDQDSTATKKVFNKTVALRDTWSKQQQPKTSQPKQQDKPMDVFRRLGKKYTGLSAEKQIDARAQLEGLSSSVSIEELAPLFNTAAKKIGTRIAVVIILKQLLLSGTKQTQEMTAFITKAQEDNNQLLATYAQEISL